VPLSLFFEHAQKITPKNIFLEVSLGERALKIFLQKRHNANNCKNKSAHTVPQSFEGRRIKLFFDKIFLVVPFFLFFLNNI